MSFDAVYEFSDVSDVLSLINPNAVICSDELTIPLSNEVRYEDVAAFNDVLICAFGTEVRYEPLSPSSESNLWSAELVNVFSDDISVESLDDTNPNAVIWADVLTIPLSNVVR